VWTFIIFYTLVTFRLFLQYFSLSVSKSTWVVLFPVCIYTRWEGKSIGDTNVSGRVAPASAGTQLMLGLLPTNIHYPETKNSRGCSQLTPMYTRRKQQASTSEPRYSTLWIQSSLRFFQPNPIHWRILYYVEAQNISSQEPTQDVVRSSSFISFPFRVSLLYVA